MNFLPISKQPSNQFLVSFDVESLFTNIPIHETINIILENLFPVPDHLFQNFTKYQFKSLLELYVCDTHLIFNKQLYKQSEGMAMSFPLGPSFANIFMNHIENKFLSNVPLSLKPTFYRRYVDDTLCAFYNEN